MIEWDDKTPTERTLIRFYGLICFSIGGVLGWMLHLL